MVPPARKKFLRTARRRPNAQRPLIARAMSSDESTPHRLPALVAHDQVGDGRLGELCEGSSGRATGSAP
jgi:hypothetical protein